jgi:hypothetical protein
MTDLNELIGRWEFDPQDDSKNVRKITGRDGREKIQVRIRGGLLQWEMSGRPDGTRPHGHESMLDYYHHLLENYRVEHGSDKGFSLSTALAEAGGQEMIDYYQRRVVLFQLGEYDHARDDALHNLALMDVLKEYVKDEKIAQEHERYRPFVIMDRARAEAGICITGRDYRRAIQMLDRAIREITDFYHENKRDELAKESQELDILINLKKKLREQHHVPLTDEEHLAQLEEEKHRAIEIEDYERAAQLRDEIEKLQMEQRHKAHQTSARDE